MSDINGQQFLTTAEALALFKQLQLEERTRKDEERNGSELPLAISEYLDSTPTYELKEEFTRFKKQVARYRNETWNQQHQINKKIIPDLKKWKTDTHQVVSSIYKYSENTRVQARAATEIYEHLYYLQDKIQFANPEDKEIFDGTLDQAANLATFGFGQAKFQDNDAKEHATKALRVPASVQYKGKDQEEDRAENTFGQEFMADLHQVRFQQRLLYNNTNNQQQHGRPYGRGNYKGSTRGLSEVGIFTREGTDVGADSPLQPTIPATPQTTVHNSNNSNITANTISTTTSTTTTTTSSTKLFRSSRRHPSGGTPDQLLQQLEENNPTPMAIETDQRRISDSICKNSNAMVLTKKNYSSRRTKGNKYCHKQISNGRNNRKVYRPKSKRLPIKVLYSSRSHQEKTYSGLPQNQPIYSGRTLQDGGYTSTEGDHRTRRFHLQNRLERRLRSNTNARGSNGLLEFRKSRHHIQVQISRVWTKCFTKNFQQNHEIRRRTIKKRRYQTNLLLGRYLHFSKDKRGNAQINRENQNLLRRVGIHNKLLEEHTNTVKNSKIPRVYVQHQEDEDFSTSIKDQQYTKENQTSQEDDQHYLSMDGRITRKDNINDSSSRGSAPPHPLSSTRSSTDTTNSSPKLGKELQSVLYQPSRVRLVGNIPGEEERTTDSKNNAKTTSHKNICRRIEHGMGNQLALPTRIPILESRRNQSVNKRTRTEDHTTCPATSCKKLQRFDDTNILGQHNGTEIHDKIRRNFVSITPRLSDTDPRNLQHYINMYQAFKTQKRMHSVARKYHFANQQSPRKCSS